MTTVAVFLKESIGILAKKKKKKKEHKTQVLLEIVHTKDKTNTANYFFGQKIILVAHNIYLKPRETEWKLKLKNTPDKYIRTGAQFTAKLLASWNMNTRFWWWRKTCKMTLDKIQILSTLMNASSSDEKLTVIFCFSGLARTSWFHCTGRPIFGNSGT